MLAKELEELFGHHDEDDIDIRITKIDYEDEAFVVHFKLEVPSINGAANVVQDWQVTANNYCESHISFDYANHIKIENQHPLLWKWEQPHGSLYFKGACTDRHKLFYDLVQLHKQHFGKHDRCAVIDYFPDFAFSNGVFATGPGSLLELYAVCLEDNGLEASIISSANKHVPNKKFKVLFTGDTFIVAKDFYFVQLETPGTP